MTDKLAKQKPDAYSVYPPFIGIPGEGETDSTYYERRAREKSQENAAAAQRIPSLAQRYTDKRTEELTHEKQAKAEQLALQDAPGWCLAMLPYNDKLRVEARLKQVRGEN